MWRKHHFIPRIAGVYYLRKCPWASDGEIRQGEFPIPKQNSNVDTGSLELHLLDMGREKYGDSILCALDNQTILIDGGHLSDWPPREEYPSISEQLEAILGHPAPF